jgi:protein-S-isoprenylcysteine O-methyltransferase Ste14
LFISRAESTATLERSSEFFWPTILTLAMFPVLTVTYVRLAKSEEREAIAEFGNEYRRYVAEVPGFFPRFGGPFGQSGAGNLNRGR